MTRHRAHMVVAGSGLAGLRAVEHLREQRFEGRITVLADPADRSATLHPVARALATTPQQTFAALGAQLRADVRPVALNTARHQVELAPHGALRYDGLVLANGLVPAWLPELPQDDPRVCSVWSQAGLRAAQAKVTRARRVLIVGSDLAACELASAARLAGAEVCLVDGATQLLRPLVGSQAAAIVTELHRRAGVTLRLGTAVRRWSIDEERIQAIFDDDESVDVDFVVLANATTPDVGWLADSGLDIEDGVRCDSTCHVVGADSVVAAGTTARWPNLRFGTEPRRVTHWIDAIEQTQAAVDNLLAGPAKARSFTPIPRCWSEQHGVKIQMVGVPSIARRSSSVEGSQDRRSSMVAYFGGDHLVGAVGFNRPRSISRYATLLDVATSTSAFTAA